MAPTEDELEHIERICCGSLEARFLTPAHLIKSQRCNRADEGKAGHQRIEQRQNGIAKCEAREHEADNRIDNAKKHCMRWHRVEIIDALGQGIAQIAHVNGANERLRGTCPGADKNV